MNTHIVDVQLIRTAQQYGLTDALSYAIADALHPPHRGQIVYVPLGKQIVIGVVVSTPRISTNANYKVITAVADIALTNLQVELAQWMARHYATPLGAILPLFIPANAVGKPTKIWHVTPQGQTVTLSEIPADERGVLYLLRLRTTLSEAAIVAQLTGTPQRIRAMLAWLCARGYIEAEYTIESATFTRPKIAVALLVQHPTAEVLQSLARAPKQRALLEQLRLANNQMLPVAQFATATQLAPLIDRGYIRVQYHDAPPSKPPPLPEATSLTDAQRAATDSVLPAITTPSHEIFLLDGVTGSGKTEVYFALIRHAIAQGKQTLVLIPEIALTTQLGQRFVTQFPGRVAIIHGQLTPKQRIERWHAIQSQHAEIIIGPRSALFTPVCALGLIIVDEEHDGSYKNEFAPYYHARDSAIMYAKLANVPIVLGSATPSIELLYAASQQRISKLTLPERIDVSRDVIALPPIRIVDMRSESSIDRFGLIGKTLAQQISTYTAQNHQVLLLLNRRGTSGSRLCRNCGHVAQCNRCSSPLVVHFRSGQSIGVCHTCGNQRFIESHCPHCFHADFLDIGSGTQRVVEVIATHWPTIPIIQWDRDTADSARDHAQLLSQANSHDAAIIVGTQMIAKGLDLAKVRLVGVVNTDTALQLPDMRAAERTYQLLTQVAGRAGRRRGSAEVIFQSYQPEHYAIQAAARYDRMLFYKNEIAYRQRLGYPPFARMIKLVWQHQNNTLCQRNAQQEAVQIATALADLAPATRIIGPAPCFFARVRDRYRWQLFIVTNQHREVIQRINDCQHAMIDVDPLSML
ncbi:MAG: primosomal protein N' [Chloroflexia bacterium]|nr:primosomal protein N' [Chloroflexia bacterium]